MRIITEKAFSRLLRKEKTTIYIEMNGVKEYVGESTEPAEVLQMLAQADLYIKNNI